MLAERHTEAPAGFVTAASRRQGSDGTNHRHHALFRGGSRGQCRAVTTTLNDNFGSHVASASLGFLLNDEMDDFAVKPGTPICSAWCRTGQRHRAGKRP